MTNPQPDNDKRTLSSAIILPEVQRLIDEGLSVILPVNGRSMLPFIIGGKDKVEFHPVNGELHIGDVLMVQVDEGYPVVHRLVAIDGSKIELEGDGNYGFREHATTSQIVARGIYAIGPNNHKRSLVSRSALLKWKLWRAFGHGHIRHLLLIIYRILYRIS